MHEEHVDIPETDSEEPRTRNDNPEDIEAEENNGEESK